MVTKVASRSGTTYLEHLGVKRHRLMEAFRPGTRAERLTDMAIVYAHLGLTTADAGLILGSTTGQTGAPDSGVWNLWGFAKPTLDAKSAIPDPADSTAWLSKIEVPTQAKPKSMSSAWLDILTERVDVFLQQSGLKYKEMLDLLGAYSVNPLMLRGNRLITLVARPGAPEDTCETKHLRLVGMDQDAAMRALRFIRLWRKLGWSMQDLDRALTALGVNQSGEIKPTIALGATGDKPIGDAVLMKLSHIQRLHETLGVAIDRLLPFWGVIDSARYIDHDSADQTPFATLYERLFRNKRVINPPDPAFAEDPSKLKELKGKLSEHPGTIAAALGLGAADLGLLLADSNVLKQAGVPAVCDDTLSLENLSALYRHATLAKALNLSIRNYLIARGLAFDPFADTLATLLFVEQVQALTASPLTLVDLDYLSRHRILESDRVAPTEAEIARNLGSLRTELARIANEHRFEDDPKAPGGPTVDSDGELTRSKLALLGWEAGLVDPIVDVFNDDVTYRTHLPSLPAGLPDLSVLNDPGVYAVKVASFPKDYAIPEALEGIVTYANGTLLSSRRLSVDGGENPRIVGG